MAPGQAVTFAVYEKVKGWLEGGVMDHGVMETLKDAKDAVAK